MLHFTRECMESGSSDTTRDYRTVGGKEDIWVLPLMVVWPLVLDVVFLPVAAVHDSFARE